MLDPRGGSGSQRREMFRLQDIKQQTTPSAEPGSSTAKTVGFWHRVAIWAELVRNLAVRDVETRYKHSLLGLYWALVNPLVSAGIYGFVFGVIFHASSKPIPYVVFLLTNLTFWNLFANGIISATTSVSGNAALLAKIYFPRVVLPTAAVLARLIDFLFSLVVLAVIIAVYRVPIHWQLLWLPAMMVIQLVFTLGIAFMVAALNVLYRDVTQLIGLVLMVWIYFSPVMYRISSVPAKLRVLLLVNPMGAVLESERNEIFLGHLLHPHYLDLAAGTALMTLGLGWYVFHRIEPLFAEVM